MTIIDTHAHLDQVENLEQALQESAQAGVEAIVAVSVDLASNKRNLEIKQATQDPKIYVGLGIHPGNIKPEEIESCLDFIGKHINEACAIGEIGLDFWYKWVRKDKEQKDQQRFVFKRQLDLAKEYDLPAIIHTRGTWRECLETTKEVGVKKAVFHWYSGPVDVLNDIIKAGYYVSASPSLASSPQSREAISHAPIERTLIETDCPVFFRYRDREGGFTAQPKDVFRTLDAYAELKGADKQESLNQFNRNAREFFGI